MTVLTSNVRDIAGADDLTEFVFRTPVVRGSGDDSVVTRRTYRVRADSNGVLTTPDLEPGPATLKLSSHNVEYKITIPDSGVPVNLWPLIEAAMPPESGTDTTDFVRNAGGVSRTQAVHGVDTYANMQKDPATVYYVFN